MKQLHQWLDDSAREWGIAPFAARIIFWMAFVGAGLLVLTRLDKELYRFLLDEDGPIEWLTVAFCFAAFVGGIGVSLRRARAGFPGQAVIFGIAGVVMLLVAIEEISWGQRVFGIETPEFFETANKQRELNIHNIGITLSIVNFGMMLVGAYGATIGFINRRWKLNQLLNVPEYLIVPPAFLTSAFLLTFLYKLSRMVVFTESGFTITKYAEYIELCLSLAVASTLLLILRRQTQESQVAVRPRIDGQAAD